jgi:YHS domain-containing protein
VCGLSLHERDPQRSSLHGDQMVFFCSRECKEKFDRNPEAWDENLKPASAGW